MQIANPNLVVEKQTVKKWVHRHPKTPLKEIFKNYDLTGLGVWIAFSLWRPPAAELLVVQQPHLEKVVEGSGCALGLLPFLCHHFGPLLGVARGHFAQEKLEPDLAHLERARKKGKRLVCNYWVKI